MEPHLQIGVVFDLLPGGDTVDLYPLHLLITHSGHASRLNVVGVTVPTLTPTHSQNTSIAVRGQDSNSYPMPVGHINQETLLLLLIFDQNKVRHIIYVQK